MLRQRRLRLCDRSIATEVEHLALAVCLALAAEASLHGDLLYRCFLIFCSYVLKGVRLCAVYEECAV